MKTNKFLTFLSVLTLMFIITSCVEDDDYGTPSVTIQEPDLSTFGTKTTFSAVISRYNDAVADGDQVGIFDTEDDAPLYIEGYVISSDASGNFYEEIIVQNSTDGNDVGADPRTGLNVQINTGSLSDTYEIGRKVYIKLNGLAIGIENGVYTLGRANGSSLEQIQSYEYQSFIKRSTEVATLTPKVVAIADLTEADENTLVQFDNMQFSRGQLGLTYAGEASDEFDGFRTLENCETSATISLQTSTFADFKSVPVAQQRGSIQGIYSRDFGDDFSVLILNSTSDVNFTSADRCDPDILECTGDIAGSTVVFEDNFESYGDLADMIAGGWEHYNIAGGVDFRIGSFSGNNYAQISGFSSGDSEIETWFVTPDINLDATTQESLNFDLEVAYANSIILSVLITENYTGDVTTTEWTEVGVDIPNVPTSGFGGFNNSGDINISCLNGNVRVAFKYLGSDPSGTTRYHIDNVEVKGN
ncbi:DUF5689 domain-containing protein [Lacinutrix iliipiscaria]|uniref:DUF5689 domain-containing protein n=1 Tax=Lacinutrix iliipiscaria TaxID=1230532 RepID=A0ABW5WJ33_9FLAO